MFDKYAHTPKNMLTHGVLGARGLWNLGVFGSCQLTEKSSWIWGAGRRTFPHCTPFTIFQYLSRV